MSLATRITALAQAVAADIKALATGKADSSHTHAVATTSLPGFMSASDKAKLDGLTGGAATAWEEPPVNSAGHLLVYYGWPIAYLGLWDAPAIVNRIASRYTHWIVGDGYQNPGHSEYASTNQIVDGVRSKGVRCFGYVPLGVSPGANRTIATLKTAIDQWYTLGVDGIFLDEFGFDYSVTRERQKEIIDYAHGKGLPIIANSWVFEDFVCDTLAETGWSSGDWRYGNFATYNPTNLALTRWPNDGYLIENFCIADTGRLGYAEFEQRVVDIRARNQTKNVQLHALAVLPEPTTGTINWEALPNTPTMNGVAAYVWAYAHMFGVTTCGVGGYQFGSSGSNQFEFNRFALPGGAGDAGIVEADATLETVARRFGSLRVTADIYGRVDVYEPNTLLAAGPPKTYNLRPGLSAVLLRLQNSTLRWYAGDINTGTALSTITLAAGRTYFIPLVVPRPMEATGLGISVSTSNAASGFAAIYANTDLGTYDGPGELLAKISTAFNTGSTGDKTSTLSVKVLLLPGKLYWVMVNSTGGPTLRGLPVAAMAASFGRTINNTTARTHAYTSDSITDVASIPTDYTGRALTPVSATAPGVFLLENL